MKRKRDVDLREVNQPGLAFGAFISMEVVEHYRQLYSIQGPVVHLKRIQGRPIKKKSPHFCLSPGYCKHQTVRGFCLTKGHPERLECQYCSPTRPPYRRGYRKT